MRWEPASGVVDHVFDDEMVPGTQGIREALLRAIEPFPTQDLVAYDRAFVSGFIVEHYQVVLIDAARRSQEAMTVALRGLCAAAVPGDTHRGLEISPQFSRQTFKHILVPVWLLTYTYGRRAYQVVVNGHTGRIAGEYPKSAWKIAFAVLAVLILVLLVLSLD